MSVCRLHRYQIHRLVLGHKACARRFPECGAIARRILNVLPLAKDPMLDLSAVRQSKEHALRKQNFSCNEWMRVQVPCDKGKSAWHQPLSGHDYTRDDQRDHRNLAGTRGRRGNAESTRAWRNFRQVCNMISAGTHVDLCTYTADIS